MEARDEKPVKAITIGLEEYDEGRVQDGGR